MDITRGVWFVLNNTGKHNGILVFDPDFISIRCMVDHKYIVYYWSHFAIQVT